MDKTSLAVNTIFVGMVVVFLSLVVLSFSIKILNLTTLFGRKTRAAKASAGNENPVPEQPAADNDASYDSDARNNSELAAVITAAVMASLKPGPDCSIRVKSFRRLPSVSPVWNSAGRSEQLAGKL